jgi:hypothetical protein
MVPQVPREPMELNMFHELGFNGLCLRLTVMTILSYLMISSYVSDLIVELGQRQVTCVEYAYTLGQSYYVIHTCSKS